MSLRRRKQIKTLTLSFGYIEQYNVKTAMTQPLAPSVYTIKASATVYISDRRTLPHATKARDDYA